MSPPGYIANFDSASAMVRSTAALLRGKDFPMMGVPTVMKPAAKGANLLPERVRERIYAISGGTEGVSARRTNKVDVEELDRWIVGEYPQRQYQAVVIGASNGAAVHLAGALQAPWLPQTTLVPVRRTGVHPDDMKGDMEWGRGPGRKLLDSNPDLQLHHMHDPNQDRLMIEHMSYFRVKRLRLSQAYKRFLTERLMPGGTIFVVNCTKKWPTATIGDRHLFQPGAVGGLDPEEYLEGSARVADFLEHYDSPRRSWEAPATDGARPEAEWGFEPALQQDIERFAAAREVRVRTITFDEPEDLSVPVADLHRWWYRKRRMISNRLIVSSFLLQDPYWTLRTGSIPYWMKFNTESSADNLERYLDRAPSFDEIYMILFSHGTESAGLTDIGRWRQILGRAVKKGRFLGVDEARYPKDFGVFARYNEAVQEIPARYPLPGPLTIQQMDEFLDEAGHSYDVRWE